jgi:aminoglycoside phosphotransferase (APT) family kinase protein
MAMPRFLQPDIERVAAEIFGLSSDMAVTRLTDGHSTFVYRVRHGETIWYLRVLPEEGDSFAPEARVHAILRERGVRVPDVVYWEGCNALLQRSVMGTTEIPGHPIDPDLAPDVLRSILIEAGRDLARINSVPVAGFGWIRRDRPVTTMLEAELPTLRTFVLEAIEARLAFLTNRELLDAAQTDAVERIIGERSAWLDAPDAVLAHGDFDATHIFHDRGRYSGVIDFGEIRGTDSFYDLGHFFMENLALLPDLLMGYGEITPLPPDAMTRIHFASLFIRIRRAVIDTQKRGAPYLGTVACIAENIAALTTR